MTRHASDAMKRLAFPLAMLVCFVSILAARLWADSPAVITPVIPAPTAPAPVAATAPVNPFEVPLDSAKAKAIKARASGLEEAMSGQFSKALADIDLACRLAPDDSTAAAAKKLLTAYTKLTEKAQAERKAEYDQAVARVQRALFVQSCLSANADSNKTENKLRKQLVDVLMPAFNKCGTSESLDAEGEAAAKVRDNSIKALDDCIAAEKKLTDMIKDDSSKYAQMFRDTLKTVEEQFKAYQAAWKSASVQTPEDRRSAGKALRAVETTLADALADVEAMVGEKPWRTALLQARMAKELAPDKEAFAKEKWLVDLIAEMDARGKKAIQDANWIDAQSIYYILGELDDAHDTYKNTEKIVDRHVRVLGLYGKKPGESKPATQPAQPKKSPDEEEAPAVEEEVPWQKYVEGVDASMVEAAIAQLSQNYVSVVDYRKVTRGALQAIKVLAETPQAVYSFKGLDDKAKKAEFLGIINREIDNLQMKDQVTSTDLQLALNTVLEASEKTVAIPTEVLSVEFTDGFLEELDKFSAMIWPHDVADFEKSTMGHFFGVGVQIHKEIGEPLKVVEPLVGTPAFKAGIKAGDQIIAVDGRRTEPLAVDKLVTMIMGPKGSKVVLQIKRQGMMQPFDVTLTRDQINITTIKGWQRVQSGDWNYMIDPSSRIAYIRMTQFTETTAPDIVEVFKGLNQMGVTSIILDLRFNPGGLLRSATAIADEFLASGRIVSTSGRQTRETVVDATPMGHYQEGDLFVLVNQYSASAAEIVSGALKDWKRAVIVGQRTYGKGSVQNVIPIHNNQARLKLTTQYYYLPSGRLLHRRNGDKDWGVNPDVDVFMTPKQLRQWLDIRRKTDLLTDINTKLLKADLADQYSADLQLETAVLLAKIKKLQEGKAAAEGVIAETIPGQEGK